MTPTSRLDRNLAVILFIASLIAFVAESQLTQVRDHCFIPHLLYSIFRISVCSDYFGLQTAVFHIVSQPLGLRCRTYTPRAFRSYLVHSAFVVIFPAHLLYLAAATKHSISSVLKGVLFAATNHLTPEEAFTSSNFSLSQFPRARFSRLIFALTAGVTYPSLLWFASVSLAS